MSDTDMKQLVTISLAENYFDSLKELGKYLDCADMRTPFILTCAATLEYLLNDLIVSFALHNYQHQDATEIAKSLYTLPLRSKLITIPSLVTAGRLVVNRQSATFAALCELIKARNMLVHNKTQFSALEFEEREEGAKALKFLAKMFDNHPASFSHTKCKRYRLALLEFTKQIHDGTASKDFKPDELQPGDLLMLAHKKK